jgi:hypothetical protein
VKQITDTKRDNDPFTSALLDLISTEGHDQVYAAGTPAPPWPRRADATPTIAMAAVGDIADHVALAIRSDAPEEWSAGEPDPLRVFGTMVHGILAGVKSLEDARGQLPAPIITVTMRDASRCSMSSSYRRTSRRSSARAGGHDETTDRCPRQAPASDRIVRMDGTLHVIDISWRQHEHHHEQVRGAGGCWAVERRWSGDICLFAGQGTGRVAPTGHGPGTTLGRKPFDALTTTELHDRCGCAWTSSSLSAARIRRSMGDPGRASAVHENGALIGYARVLPPGPDGCRISVAWW